MKKINRTACGAVVMLWTVFAAHSVAIAQDDNPRLQKLEDRLADWKQRMNLSSEQTEQIRPIVREELREVAPIVLRYDPNDHRLATKIQMARELKKIREDSDKKLKLVLTGAQWQTLQQIRKENKDEIKEYIRENR
jgi:hypothetical protein